MMEIKRSDLIGMERREWWEKKRERDCKGKRVMGKERREWYSKKGKELVMERERRG